MTVEKVPSDQSQERPAPTVPVTDPSSFASNLYYMPDPYEEALRRREQRGDTGTQPDRGQADSAPPG